MITRREAIGATVGAGVACLTGTTLGEDKKPVEPLGFVPGSATLAVLPDTQVYAMSYPHLFDAQASWIVDSAKKHNIAYTLHLGDIVNNNNKPQWEVAKACLSKLAGKVGLAMAPGNHDYGPGGNATTRDTLFNDYFPFKKYKNLEGFGGAFEEGRLDSTFHTFKLLDRDWLVVALEWGPRDKVVEWADTVLAKHPNHQAILITHAYLYYDNTRFDHISRPKQKWNPHSYGTAKLDGRTNDGEELWNKLVNKHPNVRIVINGHVLDDGLGYLESKNAAGKSVHQILVNYQMKKEGGEAYLRLLEFSPDGKTVQAKSYSPALDRYKTDSSNQFVFELTG